MGRYRRVEPDLIEHERVLYEPELYAQPYVAETRYFRREPAERGMAPAGAATGLGAVPAGAFGYDGRKLRRVSADTAVGRQARETPG